MLQLCQSELRRRKMTLSLLPRVEIANEQLAAPAR